ncbi:MAG: hypothetical protein M3Q44_03790 [bacterium]|nr:hypothetical protein [bacterium]
MQKIEKLSASKATHSDHSFVTIQIKIDNGLQVETILPLTDNSHERDISKAIEIINDIIAPILEGLNPLRQRELDKMLTELSLVHNQQLLHINISLAISFCILKASAALHGELLRPYIERIYNFQESKNKSPTCVYTLIQNLGKQGEFKEFTIIPSRGTAINDVFFSFRLLKDSIDSSRIIMNTLQLEILQEKVKASGKKMHDDIFIGVKPELRQDREKGFICNDMLEDATELQLIDYYKEIQNLYSPLITENAFLSDDLRLYSALHKEIGRETIICVSTDIITNAIQCKKFAEIMPGSMISLTHTNVYSLSQYIDIIQTAFRSECKVMIDTTGYRDIGVLIAIAGAVNADFIKIDSCSSQIEKEIEYVGQAN